MKCSRCGIGFESVGGMNLCPQCVYYTSYRVRWFVVSEECMFCGQKDETLFPGGPTSLECKGCGQMVEIPFERREITEDEARKICMDQGITLEDLM